MFGFHDGGARKGRGMRGERGCGPRTGRFQRGPFEVSWSVEGGRGRREGGRRRFDGGELRLLLLALLEEQPRHGYDLIREIDERTGGAYAPSPGVVYPTLTMLDEMGHVDELKEEGARKRFAISEAGRAHLAERREEADALLARLAEFGESRNRAGHAPVRRAMASLHMALGERLRTGDGDGAHDIAAILDEAVRQIERLPREG